MKKASICIFINNYGTSKIRIPDLSLTNPGMGGTQYEMFLLAQLFNKHKCQFKLLLTHEQNFFEKIDYELVNDIKDAFSYCNSNKIDYLILRANDGLKMIDYLENTKIIYWVHNFIDYKSATIIAKSQKVKRVIFVSQEESDYYYDHDIIKKSVVIFNAIPNYVKEERNINKGNTVAFIGDLSPYKHFDKLTKQWPRIVKKIPDARLLVLGSGDLYGKGKTFGKYNIAEANFEAKFMAPLIKHNLVETVIFNGLVKGDMDARIRNAKVTVFKNPIETFCIAATDSIKNGVPVVAPKSTGYCDVVQNKKTGFLTSSKNKQIKKIISILDNKTKLDVENNSDYLNQFSPQSFFEQWQRLFSNIGSDEKIKPMHKKNVFVNNKWIVVLLKNVRRIFHLPNCFSRIGIKWYAKKLVKRG